MFRLILVLALLWAVPVGAVTIPQSLNECNALCAQYFPGGTVVPSVDPIIPVPDGTKVCTMPITFERGADQNNGKPAVLLRTLQDSAVVSVIVNGEVARRGVPYKGCPVYLLANSDVQYLRPLQISVKTSDGQTCIAKSGSATTPTDSGTSTGSYSHSANYDSYGVRNQGRQAWRINKRGDSLGAGPIKFTFASGKTFIVKNPLKNCRDQENCSRNSRANMYGFVYKPGIGPNGDGDDNTGTSHGGIYLHAPFGDSSKTVMMQW